MHQDTKLQILSVQLRDLVSRVKIASTFIDTGVDVLSGDSNPRYPAAEAVDRGLLMIDAYRDVIEAVMGEIESLANGIDPES